MHRVAYIPYFKINVPIFCCFTYFEECLNLRSGSTNFDYCPSPSELTSRIHPLIFLWTLKAFISPGYFLNFISNLYISPCLQKSFKFMVIILLENTFLSQKIESGHFYSCPQSELSPVCFFFLIGIHSMQG